MSRRTLVLFLSALSFGYGGSLMATLQVSGEVWYTVFDEAGTGQRRTTRSFDATIDGCRWRIRTSQLGTNDPRWGDSPYVYMEIANGADSLFVTRLWDTTKLPPADPPYMEKSVTVSWGKVPYVDGEQFTAAIWFPYAWECELGMITNGRVKYFLSMNDSFVRDDITFPFTVRYLSNSSPRMIQELLIHNEGFFYRPLTNGTVERIPIKPPYSAGFIQSSLTVLETTNVGGLVVPQRSQIKSFMSKRGALTNISTRLSAQVDLVAKTVRITNSFLPPPELVAPPAIIYDKRLRKMRGEYFWYFSKGLIYETNSPEVERIYGQFEEIEAMTPREPRSSQKNR